MEFFFLQGYSGGAGFSNSSRLRQNVAKINFRNRDSTFVCSVRQSLTVLQEKGIRVIGHSACSPDLIENVWGCIARNVYGNDRKFDSVNYLRDSFFRSRRKTPKTLISSMPRKIFEVNNKNEG